MFPLTPINNTIGSNYPEFDPPLVFYPDYEEVVHDSHEMLIFNNIFQDLEIMLARELDVKQMIQTYGKLLVNSFAIQDEYLRPIGRGVYLGWVIDENHKCKERLIKDCWRMHELQEPLLFFRIQNRKSLKLTHIVCVLHLQCLNLWSQLPAERLLHVCRYNDLHQSCERHHRRSYRKCMFLLLRASANRLHGIFWTEKKSAKTLSWINDATHMQWHTGQDLVSGWTGHTWRTEESTTVTLLLLVWLSTLCACFVSRTSILF